MKIVRSTGGNQKIRPRNKNQLNKWIKRRILKTGECFI